ncbi:hypothetical protein IV203_028157 [Nitzschia inconspicua]|uniref:Uncharacterized protein n=1 Tax=Nitzschia inconspicua TaxID=303405 RepID=A0A9K3M1A0_9STRA|nr:hypothetical protein IV203_028181 [Nitzschia inconspicua]KAG7344691.1 hypothetical protein IV203_032222 [Nitzschia inconspicua]KAG7370411.1 hypothetical protein IV203_028157 [Nitzschia inconspicua]
MIPPRRTAVIVVVSMVLFGSSIRFLWHTYDFQMDVVRQLTAIDIITVNTSTPPRTTTSTKQQQPQPPPQLSSHFHYVDTDTSDTTVTTVCFPWPQRQQQEEDDNYKDTTKASYHRYTYRDDPSDEWWTHHPDYHVIMENKTHFCFAPLEEGDQAILYRQLYRIQFPSSNNNNNDNDDDDCQNNVFTRTMWSSGWGADMTNINTGLRHALIYKRPFQVRTETPWHYAAGKYPQLQQQQQAACPTQDMFCYFLPLSNCSVPEKTDTGTTTSPTTNDDTNDNSNDTDEDDGAELDQEPGCYYGPSTFTLLREEDGTNSTYPVYPAYNDDMQFYHWLDLYASRPKAWLRQRVYEYQQHVIRNDMNMTTPCAVMHVRRGDVLLHTDALRRYYAVSEYIQAAGDKLNDTIKNILLLTDDDNAIGEALHEFPKYNWMYLHRKRYKSNQENIQWEEHTPSMDFVQETVILLTIFRLVQKCDGIVHGYSNLAEIMKRYMKYQPPKLQQQQQNDDYNDDSSSNNNNNLQSKAQFWDRVVEGGEECRFGDCSYGDWNVTLYRTFSKEYTSSSSS